MKNKIIKMFSVFAFILLVSGCVKYNANMKITNDKKMKFELIIAVSKEMQNQEGVTTSTGNDETLEKLKNEGWKVEEYEDSKYVGSKLTKTYDNIDDISSNDPSIEFDLNALFQEGKEAKYVFYKKEDNGKITYYAKVKADVNSGMMGDDTDELEEYTEDDEYEEYIEDEETDDYVEFEEDDDEDLSQQQDMENMMEAMMKTMDLKFTVEVPKVIKNNATSVDGNKLTWDLTKIENDVPIEFEFELTGDSFSIIPFVIGGGVIVLAIVALLVIKGKKTKNNMSNGTIQSNSNTASVDNNTMNNDVNNNSTDNNTNNNQ